MVMNILFLIAALIVGFVLGILAGRKNRQGVEKTLAGIDHVSDEYKNKLNDEYKKRME